MRMPPEPHDRAGATDAATGTAPDAERLYAVLLVALRSASSGERAQPLRLVGIHSGGAWVAERLHRDLGLPDRIGTLDISFYRDDFDRIGLHGQVKPTEIGFDVNGADIVLVDDVLYTGRTIRGAINVLFDYGRPARIELAVLIDRETPESDARELPIAARWAGARIALTRGREFVLTRDADHFRFAVAATPVPESRA